MKYERAAIMGVGSIGIVLGALLAQNGVDVELIDRNVANVEVLSTKGATVVGSLEMNVPVKAYTPDKMTGKYDIVFLDPPYGAGLMPEALRKLDRGELYAPGAVIVCETDNGTDARPSRRNRSEEEIEAKEAEAILQDVFGGDESLAARYEVQKSVSYGRARITLLRPVVSEV